MVTRGRPLTDYTVALLQLKSTSATTSMKIVIATEGQHSAVNKKINGQVYLPLSQEIGIVIIYQNERSMNSYQCMVYRNFRSHNKLNIKTHTVINKNTL